MTNEFAVKWIAKNIASKKDKAKRLAASYAMDDIVHDDIEVWMNEHVSGYLYQFVEISKEIIEESKDNGTSCEDLLQASMSVAESMLEYSRIHNQIISLAALYDEETVSER